MTENKLDWDAYLKTIEDKPVSEEFKARCRDAAFKAWAYAQFVRPLIQRKYEGTPYKEAADEFGRELLKAAYLPTRSPVTGRMQIADLKEAGNVLLEASGRDEEKLKRIVGEIGGLLADGMMNAQRDRASGPRQNETGRLM